MVAKQAPSVQELARAASIVAGILTAFEGLVPFCTHRPVPVPSVWNSAAVRPVQIRPAVISVSIVCAFVLFYVVFSSYFIS